MAVCSSPKTVVVKEKKEFKPLLTYFDVSPKEVEEGGKVTVYANVRNFGNTAGTVKIYTVVNNHPIKETEKTVTLSPGQVYKYKATLEMTSAGKYSVTVYAEYDGKKADAYPKTVVVKEKKIGAKPEITYFDVSPKEVEEGGSVTVTANVRNSGDTAGTFKIYTVVNGSPLEGTEKLVTLKPGSQHTYKKTLEMTSAGSYSVSVCAEVL